MKRGHQPVRKPLGRLGAGIITLALLASMTAGSVPASFLQASDRSVMTAERWARDLDVLAVELPKQHKSLFFRVPEAEFLKAVGALKKDLPTLGQDEITVRLLQLVASVGDSHTAVGYRPQRGLPLMLYWFKDGITVLNTTAEYKGLLYGRITALAGRPIEEVTAALASVIPHENGAQVKNLVPNFLVDTAVLHGLKLIPSADSASLTVVTGSGSSVTADMTPISFSSKPAWVADTAEQRDAPLYLRKGNVFYWYEVLARDKALYFKYNSCREIADKPFAAFVKEMFAAADAAAVDRVVVDLRHNGGGDSSIFGPFLEALKKRPALLQKGKLAVIVGRRTFSSAVLNALDLRKETPAVVFGEPSGGKPNHFGEVQAMRLPESGLTVSFSTKYFQVVPGDPEAIVPDVLVEHTFADYRAKSDPVLDAALGRTR